MALAQWSLQLQLQACKPVAVNDPFVLARGGGGVRERYCGSRE